MEIENNNLIAKLKMLNWKRPNEHSIIWYPSADSIIAIYISGFKRVTLQIGPEKLYLKHNMALKIAISKLSFSEVQTILVIYNEYTNNEGFSETRSETSNSIFNYERMEIALQGILDKSGR